MSSAPAAHAAGAPGLPYLLSDMLTISQSFRANMLLRANAGCDQITSPSLRRIFKQSAGQQARLPIKWAIKPDYLAYHRAEVLQAKPAVSERVIVASPT